MVIVALCIAVVALVVASLALALLRRSARGYRPGDVARMLRELGGERGGGD